MIDGCAASTSGTGASKTPCAVCGFACWFCVLHGCVQVPRSLFPHRLASSAFPLFCLRLSPAPTTSSLRPQSLNPHRQSLNPREKLKSEYGKRIIEGELKALRLQMNPHFMFNSLNSIQYFLSNNESELAVKYLSKFAKLMRMILENSRRDTITLDEEIQSLTLYLEIEEIRFNSKFRYEIICDPDINIHSTEILPMIIQPFVENAILHGVTPKKENGVITVSFSKGVGEILVTIDDNGIGREEAERRKSLKSGNHHSLGLKVTDERLGFMNMLRQANASIEVIDKTDSESNKPEGTRVIIHFPDSLNEEIMQ